MNKQQALDWAISSASSLLHDVTWTMRSGLAAGMRRRYGPGFKPRRRALTAEEAFLARLDLRGMTIYDVGGYIGLYTLFFARAAGPDGRVFTFEPNPHNAAEIAHHIRLNGCANAELIPVGVADHEGSATFAVAPSAPARGHVVAEGGAGAFTVRIESLDYARATRELPAPDFIKIDVEGLELEVLKGAATLLEAQRPELFIELHGQLQAPIIALLIAHGYTIRHIEDGCALTDPDRLPALINGHLFCAPAGSRNAAALGGGA